MTNPKTKAIVLGIAIAAAALLDQIAGTDLLPAVIQVVASQIGVGG